MRFLAEPDITVGIMSAPEIHFNLKGKYTFGDKCLEGAQTATCKEGKILWQDRLWKELTFTPQRKDSTFSLLGVTIGKQFHWERQETQTFSGKMRLIVDSKNLVVINQLPVEEYLTSVVSSEMKATCSLNFLQASAVVARSWLFAQLRKKTKESKIQNENFTDNENEIVRWYDREDHLLFDVCADDHCQRYQGLTRASDPHVREAVIRTRGQVLTYKDEVCDARFSKCCGGRTNEFQYCWQNIRLPYLSSVEDPYCNTSDPSILRQVLNDYDLETKEFYRWEVEYSQKELHDLLKNALNVDFGQILELEPVEQGPGGHISKLRIVGTKRTLTIGKELEIRRALSPKHLKSSSFSVTLLNVKDGIPERFLLKGRGWGHGVGMCQIGAAVMGQKGKSYKEILLHYFSEAQLEKVYD